MAKKGPRNQVSLQCSECKEINYHSSKNKQNSPDRLELKKFCRRCKKNTLHKELKK